MVLLIKIKKILKEPMFSIVSCLLLLLQFISTETNKTTNPFKIKQSESTKRLLSLTNYKTFYELLDLSPSDPKSAIEKAYRIKLMDKGFLANISIIDKRNLLSDAVNFLLKNREAYERELAQVDFLSFGVPKWIGVVFLVFVLMGFAVLIDFCLVYFRHRAFLNKLNMSLMMEDEHKSVGSHKSKGGHKSKNGSKKKQVSSKDLVFEWKQMYFYRKLFGSKKSKYE
ncbi:hypothetical protein CDIK_2479 [Cucumispora dikerogammari]|nr:hypothetical protein CDIK_2479 [Cucumispora dikerogammari]